MDVFDSQWGIDINGEFFRQDFVRNKLPFIFNYFMKLYSRRNVKDLLSEELTFVKILSSESIVKLSTATDAHIGLELLQLFILDLLGRETTAARIFELKSGEEFEHSVVVAWHTQLMAWIIVVALNLFFAIYSVLRGYQKGVAWQYSYLTGCITQLIIEIFMFETIEVIWLNFLGSY
jgi:sterol desaturase/sphingolipid hydroxylase (fatty acid hydroxylase superfamily)